MFPSLSWLVDLENVSVICFFFYGEFKMKKEKLTQKELKEVLHYDKDTGNFTWLKAIATRIKVGCIAGCIDKYGYMIIKINGRNYKAHRLAFLYMDGAFPPNDTDHINHLRADNRFVNLRQVTQVENGRNKSMQSNNKSGFTGVYWHKRASKWVAKIYLNGKDKHLGCFTDIDDAIEARKRANVEHGFHENHG
jgi:hypothetical protein